MIGVRSIFGRIEIVAVLAVLAATVFYAIPGLDLAVTGLFGDRQGFPLCISVFWNAVRDTMIGLTDGTMIVVIGMLFAGLAWTACRILHTRVLVFAVACYAVGPGLLVNAVLKTYSGRARPWNVDLFGGDAAFTPVLNFAGECRGHCSFVSGEASALATVATILFLVAVPALPVRHRLMARVCIVAVAVFGSLLRVAFGAHFLSDVIFAWLVAVPVVLVLHTVFRIDRLTTPFVTGVPTSGATLQDRNPGDSLASR